MVKIKNLETRAECKKKAYYMEGSLDSQKSYHYFTGVLLSSLIKEKDFLIFDEKKLSDMYEKAIPQSLFVNVMEYAEQKQAFIERFKNMQLHFRDKYEVVENPIFGQVKINGVEIDISNAVLIKETKTGKQHLATIKSRKMKLTLRGRKEETMPSHSIELAALQTLAKEKFGEDVGAMMICLKSRNGKSSDTHFEEKATQNIIGYTFEQSELDLMGKHIAELNDLKIKKNSSRNITTDCDNCPFLTMCQPTIVQNLVPKAVKKITKSLAPSLNLTESQFELIFSEKGIIRANAGAGAGKTTVIAARYLNILATTDIKPSEMLLITYTRKGAEEMKKRILEFAPEFNVTIRKNSLKIMTFHEFCQDFISKNKSVFKYKKLPKLASISENMSLANEVILSTEDKVSFFRYNNPTMNLFNARGALYQLLDWMTMMRDMKDRMENFKYIEETYEQKEVSEEDQKVLEYYFEIFEQKRKVKGIMQYDVLLSEMMNLLRDGEANPKKFNYKHIMIDEAQDCDDIQTEIIVQLMALLNGACDSLMLIGDDAQSIFGFLKASVNNFIYLETIFDDVKDIYLEENFRSAKDIVELGNAITDLNENKIDKVSKAVKPPSSQKPVVLIVKDEETEYEEIAKAIEKDIDNGIPLSEIAVITRKNAELKKIQEVLHKKGILSIIITPEKLIERTSLKSFIALAKTLTTLPEERTSKEIYEAYTLFLPEPQESFQIELVVNQLKNTVAQEFDEKDDEGKKLFVENFYAKLLEKDFALEILESYIKDSTWEEALMYLIDLDKYTDDISYSIDESKYDGVILTTIHTSKGKEFYSVYHSLSGYTSKATNKDEERNLLFVAVTRAKEKLTIFYNQDKHRKPEILNTILTLKENKQLNVVNHVVGNVF